MLLAQTLNLGQEAVTQKLPGTTGYSATNPDGAFGPFIGHLLTAVMVIAALLVMIYLLWGAISWITSGGDKSKTEKARDQITQAIIGLIVLGATLAIFTLVQSFLGISIINFTGGSSGQIPVCVPGQVLRPGQRCIPED